MCVITLLFSMSKRGKEKRGEFDIGSRLVFGASSLAGLYQTIGENQAKEVVKTALGLGIRKFDTAPHYGCGLSERRLGEAVQEYVKKGQFLIDELEKRVELDDIGTVTYTFLDRLIFCPVSLIP